ncbi:MAG: TolB family protein, partial [Bryobacteraceae bacterium]
MALRYNEGPVQADVELRVIAAAGVIFCGVIFSGAAQESAPAAPRRVWAEAATNLLGSPSPDGRYLSFVDAATGDLALRDLKTGTTRRLTRKAERATPGEFAYFSVISPDGAQVAYAWFNEKGFYELRTVGVDGSAPRVLYRNAEAPFIQPSAWSPDGKQILTLFFRKD